ncbi:UspA [Dillenia turbinata]|uniref:UspA n=1 Tax=Dillenia turbinata TaxID=194707 RepID=A0AAN8Z7D8_9MAGN
MGRASTRMPSICLGRASTRVRARSPQLQNKATYASPKSGRRIEFLGSVTKKGFGTEKAKPESVCGNKIMVVVDSSSEAKCALRWSLSHTVKVEVALTRGKEKGPAIVGAAKQHGASLLVLGQRRRTVMWRLMMMMWRGNRVRREVVEYCIQNASCMAIAVRRKGKNLGGYLITTKRQKNFWLLA